MIYLHHQKKGDKEYVSNWCGGCLCVIALLGSHQRTLREGESLLFLAFRSLTLRNANRIIIHLRVSYLEKSLFKKRLTNPRISDILKPSKKRRSQIMTKAITAVYNITTKEWAIRDNGQTLATGQGVSSWARALIELKQTATKPIRKYTKH